MEGSTFRLTVSDRLRRVARKVLDNALPVRDGDVVVFYAGVENLDLAYALAGECEVRGVETVVLSRGDYISRVKLEEAPLECFARVPKALPALVEVADWFVLFRGSAFDVSFLQRPELRRRLMEIRRVSRWSVDDLIQLCLERKTHLVAFLDPNLQQAQALGKSYAEVREMFLDSLDIDYDALTELGERIIDTVSGADEIRLTCPHGSDLRLRVGDRRWMNDDGKPEPGQYLHNLPVGEVFVAPLEDSAYGVVYPTTLPGSLIDGVRIEFRGPEKAVITAERGEELLRARLERATGNPCCIAEFAFGTNPCADILLATEKAYGTCHVAIGQNTWLGGENECSIHWDFLIDRPTVTVDGEPILRDGRFLV